MTTVILVTNDGMGKGNPELQHILVTKYFQLLLEDGKFPAAICFYADGVKLVCDGSPVLDQLRNLQEKGVHVIVCSTCLSFYGLTDQVQVGLVAGMPDIIEAQWLADKVITI
ncbi:MAG TPA: DsrE family protein [Aggregatilineaceae bacterium]|nr:DsrE family protein [Aggregatilineaceae bacterium]